MIRQDHQTYQRKLVQSFKQNQKKYSTRICPNETKQSDKTKVCRILKSSGSRTSSDKETADIPYLGNNFNPFFSHEMETDVVADKVTETIPIEFDESIVLKIENRQIT